MIRNNAWDMIMMKNTASKCSDMNLDEEHATKQATTIFGFSGFSSAFLLYTQFVLSNVCRSVFLGL